MSLYQKTEGRSSFLANTVLLPLYGLLANRRFRAPVRRLILKLEGGPVYSNTIRRLYDRHHNVDVGLYTIGPCEGEPENFAPRTTVGRYSSIYYTVRVLSSSEISPQQPYPRNLLRCSDDEEPLNRGGVRIGNDVFIGHNAIILPSVRTIEDGAFIGAGSVVQNDVPAYAVVTGNPARVVRYRFPPPIIKELLESQWWKKSISELSNEIDTFTVPL